MIEIAITILQEMTGSHRAVSCAGGEVRSRRCHWPMHLRGVLLLLLVFIQRGRR